MTTTAATPRIRRRPRPRPEPPRPQSGAGQPAGSRLRVASWLRTSSSCWSRGLVVGHLDRQHARARHRRPDGLGHGPLRRELRGAPTSRTWLQDGRCRRRAVHELDDLLQDGPLGDLVVSLRVWSPDGDHRLRLDRRARRTDASRSRASSPRRSTGRSRRISATSPSTENAVERQPLVPPARDVLPGARSGSDEIIAVVEFYQLPDAIDREVGEARLAVLGARRRRRSALSFLLLFGIVKQGSDTIARQESALKRQVGELSGLLAENAALNDTVRAAAERDDDAATSGRCAGSAPTSTTGPARRSRWP